MIAKKTNHEKIILYPGEYHFSNKNVAISTLLGSCISACLYDPVSSVVGMNHFLLSSRKYSRNTPICITEAGRYGVHAMELVINGMFKLGANRSNLRAKVFGGSSFFQSRDEADNFFCVGEVNKRFILEFLKNDGIPLIASDLGGDRGRAICFFSDDYSVMVKKTKKPELSGLLKTERHFWLKSIEDHGRKEEPDVWA